MRNSSRSRARARLMERLKSVALVVTLVALAGVGFHIPLSTAEGARTIPPAAMDTTAGSAATEKPASVISWQRLVESVLGTDVQVPARTHAA